MGSYNNTQIDHSDSTIANQFHLLEATVDEIHNAMRNSEITSKELVERYLERIDAYDRHGPELNSVVTINEDAVERAVELDERLETNEKLPLAFRHQDLVPAEDNQ